ncbi:MAG: UDP-N-acetylmuramoyl-tripeptide--D-alanyl-D-alanine ligase [Actinobacteria bacterium]|nr:UDP-N-acetylmuramoyl-tripeptide--D-alanyl-D-alanine ligase [Actinomycetota bacterium]
MIALTATQIARAIGGRLQGGENESCPRRATIDSRGAGAGDLFFGLPGESHDGGAFAADALRREAWGVVVAQRHFEDAAAVCGTGQAVFGVEDPVVALGAIANRWRHELGARVIGVTGSTGKTSTKDILAATIGKTHAVVATSANFNTEIGLPLTVLDAPPGTEVLVLEMAMRGAGQIAELARIAEPDVGCVVNVGPVHLEQLGTVEAVAAAKAELLVELPNGATAVIPADEPRLAPFLRDDLRVTTFGEDGAVRLADGTFDPERPHGAGLGETNEPDSDMAIAGRTLRIQTPGGIRAITPSFREGYLVRNLLAAVACAEAIGIHADGELNVRFSALRGELLELPGEITLINDCYNANPVSMRAALENLSAAKGRRLAVLGGMAELGADSDRYHAGVADDAARARVDMLISVGELAGAYGDHYTGAIEHVPSPEAAAHVLREIARPGDTVLVKGSRSVGLERVAELLLAGGSAA